VREYSTALQVSVPSTGNLTDDVVANAAEHPRSAAFARRVEGIWTDVTAADFLADVRAVAKGLIAAGIEVDDRVALISRTRYEWTVMDYAIWFAGAATVPVYETSSADQIGWILAVSVAGAAITETADHSSRVKEVRDSLPELHHVWSIEGNGLGVLRTLGEDVSDDELEARRTHAGPGDLATLIYTSGTTGSPKGCMITHGNFMFEVTVAVEDGAVTLAGKVEVWSTGYEAVRLARQVAGVAAVTDEVSFEVDDRFSYSPGTAYGAV